MGKELRQLFKVSLKEEQGNEVVIGGNVGYRVHVCIMTRIVSGGETLFK